MDYGSGQRFTWPKNDPIDKKMDELQVAQALFAKQSGIHYINVMTGACALCGARQEEFQDCMVRARCLGSREALDRFLVLIDKWIAGGRIGERPEPVA